MLWKVPKTHSSHSPTYTSPKSHPNLNFDFMISSSISRFQDLKITLAKKPSRETKHEQENNKIQIHKMLHSCTIVVFLLSHHPITNSPHPCWTIRQFTLFHPGPVQFSRCSSLYIDTSTHLTYLPL